MSLTVLAALGHRHEASVATSIEQAPQLQLVRRCADLAELLSAAAAGIADVAVVSADVRGLDREVVDRLARSSVAVVGFVSPMDEEAERRLRQLGLRSVLPADADPGTISEAVHALVEGAGDPGQGPAEAAADEAADEALREREARASHADRLPTAAAAPGLVTAVWGPTGAPGRTMTAVTLASLLADSGLTVVLVDLDTWGASVGQVLGLLDEAPGVAAAARLSESGSLDVLSLSRIAPTVSGSLRVLTGITDPARWPEVRGAAVEDILSVCRRLAQHVVVDCGFAIEDDEELSYDTRAPRRNAATLAALAEADEVVVVGAADPVGLQRLVRAVDSLRAIGTATPLVVVNRVRSAVAGAQPERSIGEILTRFAGFNRVTFVPADPGAADAALLAGRALAETAPESPVVAALAQVAADVDGRFRSSPRLASRSGRASLRARPARVIRR